MKKNTHDSTKNVLHIHIDPMLFSNACFQRKEGNLRLSLYALNLGNT